MTTEDLKTLYDRAMQYCIAKYNHPEPDIIKIGEYGILTAVWYGYDRYGDDTYEEFSVEDLTADLDELIKERKERELQQFLKAEKLREERNAQLARVAKEQRYSTYLELKKEFGE